MNAADVLNLAADQIAARGLFKQGSTSPWGAECTVTSIRIIAPTPALADLAYAAMIGYLGVTTDLRGVIDWNDAPDRTQAEVVAALRECAAIERAAVEVLRATAVIEEARAERTAVLAEPVGVAL